jgi:Domain of unknown function (DUF4177)
MKKFEYKTLKTREKGFWSGKIDTNELELYLNKMGFEGWELVSAVETNTYQGGTNEIVFVLKENYLFKI